MIAKHPCQGWAENFWMMDKDSMLFIPLKAKLNRQIAGNKIADPWMHSIFRMDASALKSLARMG